MIKKDKKLYKIVLAVFGLLVFFNFIGFLKPLNNLFSYFVDSLAVQMRIKTIEDINNRQSKDDLLVVISDLENKLAQEKSDLASIESLKKENQELREFFNFFDDNSFSNHILAEVVWQEDFLNFSKPNNNLIINKGKRDGLINGLALVNNSGILVGKVIEVQDNYSKICLTTNNFCKIAVIFSNEDNSSGLSEGDLGLSIKVDLVPQNENISEGDIVFSSGLDKKIPKGLYVGEVINIEKKENDIWQDIRIKPFFDFRSLSKVAVLLVK